VAGNTCGKGFFEGFVGCNAFTDARGYIREDPPQIGLFQSIRQGADNDRIMSEIVCLNAEIREKIIVFKDDSVFIMR